MRKLIPLLAIILALVSCATMATSMTPQDLGVYNPKDEPEANLCTLRIMGYIKVIQIDTAPVKWVASVMGRQTTIKIPAGVHTFSVHYNDGDKYTTSPIKITAVLQSGRNYLMDYFLEVMYVRISIIDEETKKSAALVLNISNNPADFAVMLNFMTNIITPTGDKAKKTVVMENSDYTLVFLPDMVFTLTNKKNNETVKGKRGYVINMTEQTSKVYLVVMDPDSMSTEEFLKNSSYTTTADYVLVPVACSEKSVKFKLEKPSDLASTFWEFETTVSAEGEEK